MTNTTSNIIAIKIRPEDNIHYTSATRRDTSSIIYSTM
jgi:hypothetical protein